KSTLVDSILGLVPLDGGSIEVGGKPLAAIALRAWRRSVGYVAQETFLFDATVKENIRWANPNVSDAEVERAAQLAHATDFIKNLPNGLNTVVGERGVRLSVGQRQRIGLARALVGDKCLLVLDEATSALDSESEPVVIEAIKDLHGQITI